MLNDRCAGIYGNYDSITGQPLEAGRDQGHVQSGLAWTAEGARVIKNQGGDLFGFDNNLLLRAAEYTAKYNLNNTVDYDPKVFRCEAVLVGGPWTQISTANRGIGVPAWDIIYYEYVASKQLNAPWTTKAKAARGFEGAPTSNIDDLPGWGDLIWAQ
jgi:hypothetical protein